MLRPNEPANGRRFEEGSTNSLATWGIVGFIVVACAVLIGLETSHIVDQRTDVLAASRKDNANLTSSLIQHAELTFGTADAILIGLVERLEHEEINSGAVERLMAWFVHEVGHSSQFINFTVIDDTGVLIAGASDAKEPIRFSDREYITYHRTHDDGGLHIGATIRRRTGKGWIIPVTRRFNRADGTFGGVAVAAIDPQYFQELYDRLQLENAAPYFSHCWMGGC